ncbi:alpha/beta fold hydrolase [Catenuloplanes atrovinosus]|uniref:Pimeloyl-ACP methyl ester carboxylesterase n=1 Tax=Catenuloplanes atrovinosus TaxID=137266 RepID=A0AAE4CAM4_9ACTN|nr:alpha/beta hydrolase [Catenuloplanes atrovinosus]MDR7275969.1 pimeloyl-ACP methyl ester carboxylesterase [Catenuloplanes atrovinosus]
MLHYDTTQEDGEPIVALSGGAARHPEYLGDLAGIGANGFRLVIPHLRGIGLSSGLEPASFWEQAADLEELRLALGRERLIIAGHSAGTRLAIAYAAQYPQRVAALVLITPPSTWLVPVPSDADTLIAPRRGDPAVDDALALWAGGPPAPTGDDAADDVTLNAWFRGAAPVTYARWGATEQAHALVGDVSARAARAYFAETPPDLPARLAAVTAPVLVVAGAVDYAVGLAPVQAVAGLFPHGRTVTIPDCGHYPWVERPDEFRTAVDAFLASL